MIMVSINEFKKVPVKAKVLIELYSGSQWVCIVEKVEKNEFHLSNHYFPKLRVNFGSIASLKIIP
jgi:hypothetical protein